MKDGADMVILDHRMPRENWLETVKAVLDIDPAVKVRFMSADTSSVAVSASDGTVGFLSSLRDTGAD